MSWQTAVVRFWMRWVCAGCFIRIETSHQGAYDPDKPMLIVSNHQSLMDIPAAFLAFGGNIRMVAKQELFWIPIFGWCMRVGGFIPLFRGNRKSSTKVLRKIQKAFDSGTQVWVAPEGTRSEDGTLANYKRGSFGLAIAAQIPVQPIVVLNSREALPKTSFLPRPGVTIHAVTLPQISTLGLKDSDKGPLAVRVRELTEMVLKNATG